MSGPTARSATTRQHRRGFARASIIRYGILLLFGLLAWAPSDPARAAAPFSPGDLVVGLGSSPDGSSQGKLLHFSHSGVLLDTLLTTSGSYEETGACFDASRNLYTTNFEANSMSKFGPAGNLLQSSFGTGFNRYPNSCVVDGTGNVYAGLADRDEDYGGGGVLKLGAAGNVLGSFSPAPDARGTDWIDLASDQCTLYYTSVGASIKRFDLCTNTQLPDFCTACDDGAGGVTAGTFFGLKLLPDGGVLVADWNFAGNTGLVRRYDSAGVQVMAYTVTDSYGSQCGPDSAQPCFFPWALALDPDRASVWVADNVSGEIFRFDLAGGSVLDSFQAGNCDDAYSACSVTGLAIVGEPTAAAPTPSTTTVTASITAANKVYDATTTATITGCSLSGVQGTDNVTCVATGGAFASASVGNGKPVSASVSLAGTAASKYVLASGVASTTASITPAPASVSPIAARKMYGSADPALTGTLSGFLAVDGVTATYSRTSGESIAGSPYTISATLSPASALGNYSITYNTAAFTITKANASVTPNATSKSYGAADPVLTGSLTGFRTGDGVTATYTRTAGESVAGSPYTISATLSPASALDNYNVTYNTAAFTIIKASASVTPNAASKVYGAAEPALTGTLTGFLPADNITASYSRTAGESVAGGPYTISATLSPAGALDNYAVAYNTAPFTITPLPASVTPAAATKVYGTADPVLTGTISGFLPTDGVTATYSRTAGETVAGSPYTIRATLSPADAIGNYSITYNTAAFTITKASAAVTPNAASKTYGTPDPGLTGTLTGFSPADGVTATYSRAAGESVAGSPYTISATLSPAGALDNYSVTYNTAALTIRAATASVTPNAATKVYGAPEPALTGALSGFLAGDGVTATYSRTAGETVAGGPYTISATLSPASAIGNYAVTYNSAAFTITPATPTVTWADPADITYPTALGPTQLNATANVPGTFAYTPPADTVLPVGNAQPLSVQFTPTDTSDYTMASAQVHINVLASDVAVAQTASTPVISVGAPAVYTVVVTSNGPGSSSNVVLTDTLPAGLTWTVDGPDAAACSPASPVPGGGTVTCNFGTLTPGATRTISLSTVTTVQACGELDNTATVTALADANVDNNSAGPVPITVNCPNVSVSKSTSKPVVSAGDQVDYQITVSAGGTGNSTNVTLTDTLPAGLTWTLTGPDAAACSAASPVAGGTTLTCNYGTLAPGDTRKITLTATTATANCGTINNTASVTDTLDITPGDNSAGPVAITVNCPHVSVVKSAGATVINAGTNATYTVQVTGQGPGTADNVVLTDPLPAGLNWTVGGPDAAACSPTSPVAGGTTLFCNFGAVAQGTTKTITLTAPTTTANCGTINNTATATATAGISSSGPVSIAVSCPVPPSVQSLSLSCPNVSLVNASFALSGTVSPGGVDPVTIQYTSPSGVTTSHNIQSNVTGSYHDSFTPNELGPWTIGASSGGVPSQPPSCPIVVYGKSVGGTFVIGDGDDILQSPADFWGSQWWKDNVWSGGVNPGVASLKGYLDAVDLPGSCDGSWSTRPGNSSKPPASIPAYMAVIVSSSIQKNGPTIFGSVVDLVIVHTNPGYGPAPGHDGSGTIVASICHK